MSSKLNKDYDATVYAFSKIKDDLEKNYEDITCEYNADGGVVFFKIYIENYFGPEGYNKREIISFCMYPNEGMRLNSCTVNGDTSIHFAGNVYDNIVDSFWEYKENY